MRNTIRFDMTPDGMTLLGAFIAQLVREGVVFVTDNRSDDVLVTLTGGF